MKIVIQMRDGVSHFIDDAFDNKEIAATRLFEYISESKFITFNHNSENKLIILNVSDIIRIELIEH